MNLVILMGNIGQEPELKFTNSGKAKLQISLATSSRFLSGDEWQDRTEWHRVSIWGNRAEALSKFLKKGDCISIEGSIRYGKYEKDGVTRYTTDINARDVHLTGGGKGGGGQSNQYQSSRRSAPKAAPMPSRKPDLKTADYNAQNDVGNDDDIPF